MGNRSRLRSEDAQPAQVNGVADTVSCNGAAGIVLSDRVFPLLLPFLSSHRSSTPHTYTHQLAHINIHTPTCTHAHNSLTPTDIPIYTHRLLHSVLLLAMRSAFSGGRHWFPLGPTAPPLCFAALYRVCCPTHHLCCRLLPLLYPQAFSS